MTRLQRLPQGMPRPPLQVAEGGRDATGDEVASTDAPHAPAAAEEGGGADEDADGDSATTPDTLPMRDPSQLVHTTLPFLDCFEGVSARRPIFWWPRKKAG